MLRRRSENLRPCRRARVREHRADRFAGRELVQRARPPRRADTGQGAHALRGPGDHVRGHGEPRRRAGRRPGRARRPSRRRGGHPLLQLPRVPRGALRRQPPRRHRHADQLAARRPRGALHPGALRCPRPCLRRIPPPTRRRGDGRSGRRARARISISPVDDGTWTSLGDLRPRSRGTPRVAAARRRRTPVDVHVGHDRAAQGRHAHARQPGLEESGAYRRIRLHECRSRACLRSAVPRRRARPDHDVAHCCGRHDHCASFVRGVGGGRRDRALPRHRRLAGTRHGQRHHGPARY